MAWLLELSSLVGGKAEVVGAGTDSGVREDVVDPAVVLMGSLEERAEVGPDGDIGLDEDEGGGSGRVRRRVDVAADDGGAK